MTCKPRQPIMRTLTHYVIKTLDYASELSITETAFFQENFNLNIISFRLNTLRNF